MYVTSWTSVQELNFFKSFCSDMYGCELWVLNNASINDFCVSQGRRVQRVGNSRRGSSCGKLTYCLASGTLSICNQICRRTISSVHQRRNSESLHFHFVAKQLDNFAHMPSLAGGNGMLKSRRFMVSSTDLTILRVSCSFVNNLTFLQLSDELFAHALAVLE